MLNSYRVAILLMILFGVAGIQAARYKDDAPSAACKRTLPVEENVAENVVAMPAPSGAVSAVQRPSGTAALAVKTVSIDRSAR